MSLPKSTKSLDFFLQSLALVLFELAANWSNILTNREGNTMKTADVLIH